MVPQLSSDDTATGGLGNNARQTSHRENTMTDAPETIKAGLTAVRDGWYQRVNVKTGQRSFLMTEYTRTDTAQAKIAELENALAAASGTIAAMRADAAAGQERIADLQGALEKIVTYTDAGIHNWPNVVGAQQICRQFAREAPATKP